MALPRLLLRVIDPAQVYFDRHRRGLEARERFAHRQAAVFGPEVVGGSRAATSAERVELAAEEVRYRDDYEAAITDAKRRWAPQLERAAAELLTTGATRIRLGGRTVDARIITFWRGDHILRSATRGRTATGSPSPASAGIPGVRAPTSSSSTWPEPLRRDSDAPCRRAGRIHRRHAVPHQGLRRERADRDVGDRQAGPARQPTYRIDPCTAENRASGHSRTAAPPSLAAEFAGAPEAGPAAHTQRCSSRPVPLG